MIVRLTRMLALSAALIVAGSAVAAGEGVEDFYKGKTVRLIVGSGAGGGSDVFSRIFAKYFGRHMPGNPTAIVQNVPAAGGVVASAR